METEDDYSQQPLINKSARSTNNQAHWVDFAATDKLRWRCCFHINRLPLDFAVTTAFIVLLVVSFGLSFVVWAENRASNGWCVLATDFIHHDTIVDLMPCKAYQYLSFYCSMWVGFTCTFCICGTWCLQLLASKWWLTFEFILALSDGLFSTACIIFECINFYAWCRNQEDVQKTVGHTFLDTCYNSSLQFDQEHRQIVSMHTTYEFSLLKIGILIATTIMAIAVCVVVFWRKRQAGKQ